MSLDPLAAALIAVEENVDLLRGPEGPQGPQGEPGADGADGRDGPPGSQGEPGADGRDGRDGVDGKDGKDGRPGPQGMEGPGGKRGPKGEQGNQGPAGPHGGIGFRPAGTAPLSGVLAAGNDADGRAITGLADPTNAQDAATKAYVLANGGSGGGVTNDAPNGSVAISDGTNITGDANFTWAYDGFGSGVLGLVDVENGHVQIEALGVGSEFNLRAAEGDATHVGGEVSLVSGGSAGYDGGALTISTGGDTNGGNAGNLTIQTGFSPDGNGGTINIRANPGGNSWRGGDLVFNAGVGEGSSGGNVTISAGTKITGGSHGHLTLWSGSGGNGIELNTAGVYVTLTALNLSGLPTSEPTDAGDVWVDPSGFLKVKV